MNYLRKHFFKNPLDVCKQFEKYLNENVNEIKAIRKELIAINEELKKAKLFRETSKILSHENI
jgi:hypothetical protein